MYRLGVGQAIHAGSLCADSRMCDSNDAQEQKNTSNSRLEPCFQVGHQEVPQAIKSAIKKVLVIKKGRVRTRASG